MSEQDPSRRQRGRSFQEALDGLNAANRARIDEEAAIYESIIDTARSPLARALVEQMTHDFLADAIDFTYNIQESGRRERIRLGFLPDEGEFGGE